MRHGGCETGLGVSETVDVQLGVETVVAASFREEGASAPQGDRPGEEIAAEDGEVAIEALERRCVDYVAMVASGAP